jgi:SAM-dependent methyltransferase
MSENSHESPLERQDWADEAGRRWLGHLDAFEGMIAPVGTALIQAGAFRAGERIVDVGCGAGPSALEIARRVSPGGVVLGVDISPVLVDAATRRAAKTARPPGAARVRFVAADAAAASPPEGPFDALFSRFGVMFFEDPYAAFASMCGWLKPGGRIVFSCWAPPTENPWILDIQAIAERYVTPPEPVPNAPGPFGLADVERTRDILAKAGFVDAAVKPWRGDLPIAGAGASPAQAAEFAMNGMHVGQLLDGQPENVRAQALAELEAMFAGRKKSGGILLPSTAFIVTARKPAAAA